MPKVRLGRVVAGVGGGLLSLDNRPLEPGADPGFLDDRYFAAATDRGILKFDVTGVEPPVPLHPWRPNRLLVGGGQWAAHLNVAPDGSTPGMLTSRSATTATSLYPLAVGPDGAIAYKVYSAEWAAYLIPADGAAPETLTTDTVLDLQLLGGRRAIWTNPDFRLRVSGGLSLPLQVGPARRPLALQVRGMWHVLYWVHPNGPVVIHPFDSLAGWVVHEGDAWGYDAEAIEDTNAIRFVYGAVGEGEQPGEVRTETVRLDPTKPVWLPDLLKAPVAPIVPFRDKLWFGWFEKGSRLPAPHNCEIAREDLLARSADGVLFAQYLAVEEKGNTPEAYEAAIAEARAAHPELPIIAYWPRSAQERAYVPRCDWVGIEGYAINDESVEAVERRIDAAMVRCPRVALIGKGYNNPGQTVDLAALVPTYSRVLNRHRARLAAFFLFSNSGRAGGLPAHPEIRPLYEELFRSITGAPPIVLISPPKPPDPPKPPKPDPDPVDEDDMAARIPPDKFDQWLLAGAPYAVELYGIPLQEAEQSLREMGDRIRGGGYQDMAKGRDCTLWELLTSPGFRMNRAPSRKWQAEELDALYRRVDETERGLPR